jgi:hypothetical protein
MTDKERSVSIAVFAVSKYSSHKGNIQRHVLPRHPGPCSLHLIAFGKRDDIIN